MRSSEVVEYCPLCGGGGIREVGKYLVHPGSVARLVHCCPECKKDFEVVVLSSEREKEDG